MKSTKSFEKDLDPLKNLKKVAWPMGLWPLSDDLFSLIRSILYIVIEISLVTCVTLEMMQGCTNTDEVIDYIELQKFGIMASIKVILIRCHRKNMSQIITSISENWLSIKDQKFFQIMKHYASIGNLVFYAQLISNSTILFLLITAGFPSLLQSLQNNSTNNSNAIISARDFPLRNKCLFMDISTISYFLIYILQSIQLIFLGFGNTGIDIYFFCLAMHICAQLEILYEQMSHFEGTDDVKTTKLRIIALIKKHRHLWKEAQALEETFSLIIMGQLVINISGICSFGIQGIMRMQTHGALAGIKSFFSVELLMMQLFLYCYIGEKLSSKVLRLSLAIYHSSWYNLPKKLSQDVYFILMIARLPFTLTAGKLLTMNLSTFTSIVKVTFSFFSVLKLMLNT